MNNIPKPVFLRFLGSAKINIFLQYCEDSFAILQITIEQWNFVWLETFDLKRDIDINNIQELKWNNLVETAFLFGIVLCI